MRMIRAPVVLQLDGRREHPRPQLDGEADDQGPDEGAVRVAEATDGDGGEHQQQAW